MEITTNNHKIYLFEGLLLIVLGILAILLLGLTTLSITLLIG